MIVVNIFGEIEQIVISKKLGITLSNLPIDWQEDMIETMEEEIYHRKFTVNKHKQFSDQVKEYDVREIIQHKNFHGIFEENEKDYLREISRKLICIDVGHFGNSMINKKNPYMDSPTNEIEFGEKWIRLYEFITRCNFNKNNQTWLSVFCMYSSERSLFENTRLMMGIHSEMGRAFESNPIDFNLAKINDLIDFGRIIDDFLVLEKDFDKLDYIISALADDNNYNAFHLFKNYSLIEMLIDKRNSKDFAEFDGQLTKYLISEKFESEYQKDLFSKQVRQIRNKIAHGDFISVKKKLEEYADEFMKYYYFDYYEYSREKWIYLSICCELDEILSKILWSLLSKAK